MAGARHYTVISQADDFDELLPPADIRSPAAGMDHRGGRKSTCCLIVGITALLVTALLAIALPLVLVKMNHSRYLSDSPLQPEVHSGNSLSSQPSTKPFWSIVVPDVESSSHEGAGSSSTSINHNSDSHLSASESNHLSETTNSSLTTGVNSTTQHSHNATNSQSGEAGVESTTISSSTSTKSSSTTSTTTTTTSTARTTSTSRSTVAIISVTTTPHHHTQSVMIGTEWLHTGIDNDEIESSSNMHQQRTWLKSLTSDPAFVPAASVAVVMLLLVVMVTAHALKRRANRRQRRRNIGRIITDLQSGDKVTLMSSDDD